MNDLSLLQQMGFSKNEALIYLSALELGLSLPQESLEGRLKTIIEQYRGFYPELGRNEKKIFDEFKLEASRFNVVLEKGLQEFEKRYRAL